MTGDATVTVWQRLADRQAFARELAIRAAGLMGVFLLTLALVVWFGVARGLRPLVDLQNAIAMRSPDDLARIKRPVPGEVQGIVRTLNLLLGQVETSIKAQQNFISDAAHQLRNPAAAVQSMAEAVRDAPAGQDRDTRISELILAARNSAHVADQLLSLDRLQQPITDSTYEKLDFSQLVQRVCEDIGPLVLFQGVEFELISAEQPIFCYGRPGVSG